MKILQVCPRYYPSIGGVEEHVRNISERLVEKYDLTVFTTDPSGKLLKEEIVNGVKVKRFKSWAPSESYYFSNDLKDELSRVSGCFDIVHAHSYHAFPSLYSVRAKGNSNLIFTPHFHGTGHTFFRKLLHIPYKFLGKKIFEKADKIICISKYEKNLLVDHFRFDNNKIVLIPNGVNLREFRNLKKQTKNYKVILYVGRLEKYKGVQYLIKALPKMDQDIILEIIGKGPYKNSLIKLARKLNVEQRASFSQDLLRSELLQKYADADAFVFLSKYEAYGISVAEALCAKTPCVVSNSSALKEWVDNENCFGIDYPINLDKLAKLIDEAIGKNVKAPKVSDWDETAEKLARLYESLQIRHDF
jgi:glycosyltransferase involved in cell wall biosynthesis